MMIELWARKGEMGNEDKNDVENTRGYDKSEEHPAGLGWEELLLVLLYSRLELVPAVSWMVNQLAHELLLIPASHYDLLNTLSSLTFSCSPLPLPTNTKRSDRTLSVHAMIKHEH
jgi:hypothetical protein